MSCGWRFECLSHEPHIVGEEFTNHTGDGWYNNALELAKKRPLDESISDIIDHEYDYYDRNARLFLIQHENCELGIVDEYGKHLTLDEAVRSDDDDLPPWYRVTSRGIVILQCAVCVQFTPDRVLPAVLIRGGESLCVKHHMKGQGI